MTGLALHALLGTYEQVSFFFFLLSSYHMEHKRDLFIRALLGTSIWQKETYVCGYPCGKETYSCGKRDLIYLRRAGRVGLHYLTLFLLLSLLLSLLLT
jgi:hypothetical protein